MKMKQWKNEGNEIYRTDNLVARSIQNIASAHGRVLENPSAKINFEGKLELEKARLERRKPELAIQRSKLKTKREVLEKECELGHKRKAKALENNNARIQSTERNIFPSYGHPEIDAPHWAFCIDKKLSRHKTFFDATLELNTHILCSQ